MWILDQSSLFFFYMWTFTYSTVFAVRTMLSLLNFTCNFFQKSIGHICFSFCTICSIVLCLHPFTNTTNTSLIREAFFINLKVNKCESFNFVVVSQYCFGSIMHFLFSNTFWVSMKIPLDLKIVWEKLAS